MRKLNSVRRYFYSFVFFVWMCSVVFNASRTSNLPPIFPNIDKLVHSIYYIPGGYFGYLYLISFGANSSLYAFFMVTSVGFLDEFIQSFVPGRDSDFFDILADSIGVMIGIILANWRKKF